MNFNKILSFATLLLFYKFSYAAFTQAKCDHALLGSGEIQINRQWDEPSRTCFIDLHPRNVMNNRYRDYYFDNHGQLMVFNSYGDGPDSKMTAARDFFLLPQVEDYPDYSIEANGDVVIKTVSGHLFKISAKVFSIISLTPGLISEKTLSPDNKGGVEFTLKEGFWLDGGFMKGASRLQHPELTTIVKTSKNSKTCSILNRDYLNYNSDGDFTFKYENEKLTAFLKLKCPSLLF